MRTTIISTFSPKHYEIYGKHFVQSLQKYVDSEVDVVLYTDVPMSIKRKKYENRILNDCCPELVQFKNRNKDRIVPTGTKGFIKDAVRFSHKSYCIVHASRTIQTDRLIWIDADTEFIGNCDKKYFDSFLGKNKFVSYLNRPDRYTETGWLCFDLTNRYSKEFFDKWEWYYNTDEIYNLSGQLDCHVFDAVKDEFANNGKIQLNPLCPYNMTKDHFDYTFAGRMTHYKGDAKENRDVEIKRSLVKARRIQHENRTNRT